MFSFPDRETEVANNRLSEAKLEAPGGPVRNATLWLYETSRNHPHYYRFIYAQIDG